MKPSIVTFSVSIIMFLGASFLIYMAAKKAGRDLFARNPDGSLGKVGKALQGAFTSKPFFATVAIIMFAMVVELTAPGFYGKWWGGTNGWALFWATILAVPLGTYLATSESGGLNKGGQVMLIVGFFGPLLLATSIGQNMAEKWDRATEEKYVNLSTTEWTPVYKVSSGEKLSYNRVDPSACILVRHGGDDKLVKLIGGCEPPEENKAAKGAEIPKDAIAKGVEFRAIGKPTKLELTRS
mgnify:CR=1 FL=1